MAFIKKKVTSGEICNSHRSFSCTKLNIRGEGDMQKYVRIPHMHIHTPNNPWDANIV